MNFELKIKKTQQKTKKNGNEWSKKGMQKQNKSRWTKEKKKHKTNPKASEFKMEVILYYEKHTMSETITKFW